MQNAKIDYDAEMAVITPRGFRSPVALVNKTLYGDYSVVWLNSDGAFKTDRFTEFGRLVYPESPFSDPRVENI